LSKGVLWKGRGDGAVGSGSQERPGESGNVLRGGGGDVPQLLGDVESTQGFLSDYRTRGGTTWKGREKKGLDKRGIPHF